MKSKLYKKEETELDNVITFDPPKLALAGSDPVDPKGQDWLKKLPNGAVFTVIRKQPRDMADTFMLGLFFKANETEKSVVLRSKESQSEVYVHPMRFCMAYELFEHITTIKEPDTPLTTEEIDQAIDEIEKEEKE